ncbi:MAG TPA: cadmium resistance transporter [Chitinophagaceae bacterium]|nr:cadmium resistance transporter [Chitinophagaceae bacterium]
MESILSGLLAFVSTNMDDIFILMLFFADRNFTARQVVAGKYLGMAALILLSLAGALSGLLVPPEYLGLMGLLPVAFGVRNLIQWATRKDTETTHERTGLKTVPKTGQVAAVTFANGGDNIAVYTPLFATFTLQEKAMVAALFGLLVAFWCGAALYLSKHPAVARTIDRYGHMIMPVVLIGVGLYILQESGSFSLLF